MKKPMNNLDKMNSDFSAMIEGNPSVSISPKSGSNESALLVQSRFVV